MKNDDDHECQFWKILGIRCVVYRIISFEFWRSYPILQEFIISTADTVDSTYILFYIHIYPLNAIFESSIKKNKKNKKNIEKLILIIVNFWENIEISHSSLYDGQVCLLNFENASENKIVTVSRR